MISEFFKDSNRKSDRNIFPLFFFSKADHVEVQSPDKITLGTIHLRRQHVLGGRVSSCADGPKVTVHQDKKSPFISILLEFLGGRGAG